MISEKFVFVPMNNAGEFLGLHETPATTTPFVTKNVLEAKQIAASPERIKLKDKLHPPDYYIEESIRMKVWTAGFKLVLVKITGEVVK